jgi:excisionase family DNA binding protein
MTMKNKENQSPKNKQGAVNSLGKRLYTLSEAAQYLGRSDWSMRELIWAGEIPVVRGNGNRKIFLDIKDIDEYIDRNKSIYT